MKGLLSEGVLPGVLRDVYVGRRSGQLHFSRGDERYSVRFLKGDIVHCESSAPQAHLGQIMVSLGMLDAAVRARASAIVDRTGQRLGEVLLGMGAIDQGASPTRWPRRSASTSCAYSRGRTGSAPSRSRTRLARRSLSSCRPAS